MRTNKRDWNSYNNFSFTIVLGFFMIEGNMNLSFCFTIPTALNANREYNPVHRSENSVLVNYYHFMIVVVTGEKHN